MAVKVFLKQKNAKWRYSSFYGQILPLEWNTLYNTKHNENYKSFFVKMVYIIGKLCKTTIIEYWKMQSVVRTTAEINKVLLFLIQDSRHVSPISLSVWRSYYASQVEYLHHQYNIHQNVVFALLFAQKQHRKNQNILKFETTFTD